MVIVNVETRLRLGGADQGATTNNNERTRSDKGDVNILPIGDHVQRTTEEETKIIQETTTETSQDQDLIGVVERHVGGARDRALTFPLGAMPPRGVDVVHD